MAIPSGSGNGPRPGSNTDIYFQPNNGYNTGPLPGPTYDTSQRAGERTSEDAYAVGGVSPSGTVMPNYGPSKVVGQAKDANGVWWNYDQYGNPVSRYTAPATPSTPLGYPPGGGVGGATWYEQQQVALDKQRIADAEKAQADQLAYQHQQQLIAESNAVEAANQAFRDAQLKSTYGTINGMAYGAAKGSPFAQLLPEPSLIKQGYIDSGQPDPWNQAAPYGGYTGSSYMNAQQPGLSNAGDPNMAVPTSGPGSVVNPAPTATQPLTNDQLSAWHSIAHQLSSPTPPAAATAIFPGGGASTAIPSMATGGTVPGNPGQPQLIMAHGGETIIPAMDKAAPTLATPMDVAMKMVGRDGGMGQIPGYAMGGVVPDFSSANSLPTDYNSFLAWHDAVHAPTAASVTPPNYVGAPITNTFGQSVAPNVAHGPQANDTVPGPGHLDQVPLSPVLTGLNGYGATITANGTPVVMSNWQRQHLMPSSISGPKGYDDYAMQQAGWSPTDLQQLGTDITGNFGKDLAAPINYAPIAVQPAPSGG